MQKHSYTFQERFEFEAGGSLPGITVAYHCSDRPYAKGDKVVWITHALTANSDPEEWWPQLVGPGKLFDSEKYFVICANMLTSPYGSSGPASTNPETGKPFYFDFPKTTVRDIVRAMILLRKALGIETIDFIVGGSIGGFQAVEWAIMEPEVIKQAVFLATCARVNAWDTAGLECQRLALEADQTFRACESLDGGAAGLKCARAQALMTYRSFAGYVLTQSEKEVDTLFADRAASYERYQGDKLVKRFDAYSYWYLTYAVDSHNVGRGRGGVEAALATIKADSCVICIDSDGMFPTVEQEPFAKAIPGCGYYVINSAFGHDGFLLENAQLTAILEPRLTKM